MKRSFNVPLYKASVRLYWGVSNGDYIRSLRRIAQEDPGEPDPDAGGMEWSFTKRGTDRRIYSIWVERAPKKPKEMGILSHEVFHLTVEILKDAGLRWGSGASEEAFTYLFEYLLIRILSKMEG